MNLYKATQEWRETQRHAMALLKQRSNSKKPELSDLVRRVASREKERILRAAGKDPGGFRDWLEDFYRDFPEYIRRQLEPVLGDGAGEFTERYVEQSRRELEGLGVEDMEAALTGWEERRSEEN